MSIPLIIRPEAETDLLEIFAWYQIKRKGLGVDFLMAHDSTVQAIRNAPYQFPEVHNGIRRKRLRRFPYAVYFLVTAESIIVIAVAHGSRHPEVWRRRE